MYIYYPQRMGGGSKRLFRKVGNESSRFYPDVNTVRRTGSFIYEEFMMTQGTDIKLYCVGKDYAHAEGDTPRVSRPRLLRFRRLRQFHSVIGCCCCCAPLKLHSVMSLLSAPARVSCFCVHSLLQLESLPWWTAECSGIRKGKR